MVEKNTSASSGGPRPNGSKPELQAATGILDDLESLQSRVTNAEQQRDDYLALLQRTQADFENYRKRVQRDLAEERRHGLAGFARELLPVVDNLQRTLDAARHQGEKGPLVQGVALVQSTLLDIFKRFGITPVDALDRTFDPKVHEAVRQQSQADVTPGTVVEVLEPGYLLHERLLRPARVVVTAPPTPEG